MSWAQYVLFSLAIAFISQYLIYQRMKKMLVMHYNPIFPKLPFPDFFRIDPLEFVPKAWKSKDNVNKLLATCFCIGFIGSFALLFLALAGIFR